MVIVATATSDLTSYLASGVSEGAIVALAALGFLVTYKATGVVNFAQGSLITLGAYIGIWATTRGGMPVLVAYVFVIAAMFVIGLLVERVAYAPLRGKSIHVIVIATFGAATIINTVIDLWYGPTPRRLAGPVNGYFKLFGASITWQRVVVIGAAAIVMAAVVAGFTYTQLGRQVRAVAADRETARLYGVPVNVLSMLAFGVAAALAGLAGLLLAPLGAIDTTSGFTVMLDGFAAAILGGFGSLGGVVVGGLIIGLIEQVFGSYNYFGLHVRDYSSIYPFLVLLVVIAVKPTGLFTKGEARGRL
jgi:branched-chain amino acid transport system permease protein